MQSSTITSINTPSITMSKTKEKIIDEEFSDHMINTYDETEMKFIKDAMDVFAAQEVKSNSTALVILFLQECGMPELFNQEITIGEIKQAMQIAKDTYFEKRSMELLEYIAKEKIELEIENKEVVCYLKNGEGLTMEELFKNFL